MRKRFKSQYKFLEREGISQPPYTYINSSLIPRAPMMCTGIKGKHNQQNQTLVVSITQPKWKTNKIKFLIWDMIVICPGCSGLRDDPGILAQEEIPYYVLKTQKSSRWGSETGEKRKELDMFRKPWTCKQVEPYFSPLSLHSQDQVLAQSIQKPLPCGKQLLSAYRESTDAIWGYRLLWRLPSCGLKVC